MKPIRTKTYLVQNFLIVLASMFAIFGLLMASKTITFFPSVLITTIENNMRVNITWGTIPMSHLGFFASLISLYLLFEFYGFKQALYASLSLSAVIFLFYVLGHYMTVYALTTENSHTDQILSELLQSSRTLDIAMTMAIATALVSTFILAGIMKTITRNYFMFLRFPLSAIVGCAGFCVVNVYATRFSQLAWNSMLIEIVTPFSQFVALVLASLIPLYLLRTILGLFRGSVPQEVEKIPSQKSDALFKAPTDTIPHAETPAEPTPESPAEQEESSPQV